MESSMNLEPFFGDNFLTLPASKDQLAAGQESKNVHRSVKQSQVGGFALVEICADRNFPGKNPKRFVGWFFSYYEASTKMAKKMVAEPRENGS